MEPEEELTPVSNRPTWQRVLLYFYSQNTLSSIVFTNPKDNSLYKKLNISEKEHRVFNDLVNKGLLTMNFVKKEGNYESYNYSLTREGIKVCKDLESVDEKKDSKTNFNMRDMNFSSINANGALFNNKGDVHLGNKVDNSKVYHIDRVDNSFIEKSSIKIINKYGEKKPKIYGYISLLASLVTIATGIPSLLTKDNIFISPVGWLAIFPQNFGIPLIGVGFVLLVVGIFLISIVDHKYDSMCPKCKRHYSKIELEDPVVRDVEVKGGIRRTTSTKFGCKHEDCDYKDTIKKNKFIDNSDQL
ncbi:hypothetical protein HYV86_00735 [Candidatus Woesearchaeota archaeon]|nr:hypothetical protein [Candidatus Woesearchaeota archaeon]